MDDPAPVRGLQGVGKADADPGDLLARQRSLIPDDVSQGRAVHQFHDDPRVVVRVEHIKNRDQSGVVQPTGRAGLAQHPLAQNGAFVDGDRCRKADLLDSDLTPQQFVGGGVDDTETPMAQFVTESVTARDYLVGAGSLP